MTTVIYSDAADGYIGSADNSYGLARAGTGAVLTANGTNLAVGQDADVTTKGCYETFISFDTSSITGPTTTSLQLYGLADGSTLDFTAQAYLYDWGSTLTTADWVPGGSLSALTALGTWESSGYTAAYNIFSDFDDNLDLSGSTRILIASDRLAIGNAPTTELPEYVVFYSSEASGTTTDPKLVISPRSGGWGVGMIRMGAS